MSVRKRVLLLTLVLATVALAVAGVTLVALYQTSVEGQRDRLRDTALSRARLIEAVARFDLEESADFPGGARAATLSQLRDAHEGAPGLGETGEFLVGYLEGDTIRFALPQRHAPEGAVVSLPLDSELGEPMRRALLRQSGTLIGLDYRGERVLAAHEPLSDMEAGVVAKIDLAEIRAPFVRAGLLALAAALALTLLGTAATYRIGGRMATEILELEDLKRVADERLRLAVEGAGLGFWEVDFDRSVWRFSEHLREHLGYAPGEIDSTLDQWEKLLHPEDRARAEEARKGLASGETRRYDVQYRLRAADGGWRWIHSLGALVDPGGGRAVGVHRDVTTEHEMLKTLQRSEERLSGIVDALPGSLVTILDADFRYLYAAGEGLALLGLTPEDLLGHRVGHLLDEEMESRTRMHYGSVLKGATVDYELDFGEHTLLIRATPIRGGGGGVERILALATDITEQKDRERLVHRQREQLDRIVENIPRAVVMVLDNDLRVEFMGGEAVLSGGIEPRERMGTPVLDWVADDHREQLETLFRRALAGEPVRLRGEFPGEFRRSDGRLALEISASPLRGPDGRVQGILTLALDVSEEWEARKALEATQERLRLALEAGQHATFDLDVASGRLEVSDLYATMLGHDPEGFQVTLSDWEERLHPDDRERALGLASEYLAGQRDEYHSEFRQRTASGGWVWIRSVAQVVERDAEGNPSRVMGTHTDITAEKEAERSRELLSAAVEQSSSLVLITDVDGIIEYVNPEFERVTGYAAEEVVGRDTSFLESDYHDRAMYEDMWERLRRGESFETEFVNRKKDGSEYRQQTLISPILAGDGRILSFVSIARDVTQERALEEQLRQAQKMEAVGQLTGGIAHDFNNVLTGILSNVRLALESLPDDAAELREELREVQKSGRHGAGLVRKLMAFSRDRHMDREPVRLSDFLDDAAGFLARTLPESIRMEVEDESGGAVALLDPGAMQQVLLNLATNARDAMPEGGTLTLRVALEEGGERVTVQVSDDGRGMAPQVAARIFEPFFTTKDEGTGLGLAMVYALTERQGGTVTVASEPGQGTTFRLAFPVTDREPEPPLPPELEERRAPGSGTILVVEDEEPVRRAARRILERAGYTVEVAEDGEKALALLETPAHGVDLVVTDMVMPRMGGAELWSIVSSRNGHPPFLFTSGYADRDLTAELGDEAETRFLRKPWDGAELLSMVHRILHEEVG